MASNRVKMALIIAICIGLTSMMLILLETSRGRIMLEEHATEDSDYFAQRIEKTVHIEQARTETAVRSLAAVIESDLDVERAARDHAYIEGYTRDLAPVLRHVVEGTDGSIGAYVYFRRDKFNDLHYVWYSLENGEFVLQQDHEIGIPGYLDVDNPLYRDDPDYVWYYGPIKEGKGLWTNVYEDPDLKMMMYSYAEPVYVDGKMIAVVGIDRGFDDIARQVKGEKRFKTGFAFMLDRDGNYIVSPTEYVDGLFRARLPQMTQQRGTIVDEEHIWGYSLMDNGYMVITVVPKEDALSFITELRNEFIIVSIIITVLMMAVGIIIADGLTKDT